MWVPVMLIASAAVLVLSGRPVYYRSMRRVSRDQVMPVVKFRAMVRNAEQIANRETVPVVTTRFLNIPPDSPLYTSVGRVLERLGLTELPQLLLVAKGHMSVVGNRPLPENVMVCLREEYPHADERFLVRSGLTGPAQLVGRMALSDDERLTLEAAYCRAVLSRYSVWLDFKVLLYTVLIVARVKTGMTYADVMGMLGHGPEIRTSPLPAAGVSTGQLGSAEAAG